MKSTITKKQYEEIYRLLNTVTPLGSDCGELCGAACCTVRGDEEMGIFLLPGEEELFADEKDWIDWEMEPASSLGFPVSWDGDVAFGCCKNPPYCKREMRPIQCRSFPLIPHITGDGELILLYNDTDLPYSCPLIEEEIPLSDEFYNATYSVWELLIKDPLIYDLVKQESEVREEAVSSLAGRLFTEES